MDNEWTNMDLTVGQQNMLYPSVWPEVCEA